MGYLLMPGPVGNFNKGVISVWFRIPSATVAAARGKPYDTGSPWVMNFGLIPIVTWGEQKSVLGVSDVPAAMPPSHIGVRVGSSDYAWGQETLEVRLQTPDLSTGSGDHWTDFGQPDWFGNSPEGQNWAGYPKVLIDHWNHVILSWDVHAATVSGGGMGTTSQMWCSINDKDISGSELPAMGQADGSGPNNHLSRNVIYFLGLEDHSANLSVTEITSTEFAVPSHPVKYVPHASGSVSTKNPVLRVEMAELQVFADVTVDTGDISKRRAFVSERGSPVSPLAADDDGNPIGSVGALGKMPEILLVGASDWAIGYNSGSLGMKVEVEGMPPVRNPKGQFTPTGNIHAWEPGPSLYGSQSPAPPPDVRLTKNLVTS